MEIAKEALMKRGWITTQELSEWYAEVERDVEETASKVLREPAPDPAEEDWNAFATVGRSSIAEELL